MEDHTEKIPVRTMELCWLYMDIACPVKFDSNLINTGYSIDKSKVTLEWKGMDRRTLILLDSRKAGFFRKYTCSEETIKMEREITADSDLQDICFKAVAELLWLFGWETYSESHIRTEIQTMLDGKFP